ncbi:MAG: PIN domain-containing protein [Actinomycetes bacterium]
MIVIDTNVFSELMAARNESPVLAWIETVEANSLFYTAITRAEIRYGIERLPSGARKDDLSMRAQQLFTSASDKQLNFDGPAADAYGFIVAKRESLGRRISIADAQIAAIALVNQAQIATRNVHDFQDCGIRILNPWLHI